MLTGSGKEKKFKDKRISTKLEKHKVAKKKKKKKKPVHRTRSETVSLSSLVGAVADLIEPYFFFSSILLGRIFCPEGKGTTRLQGPL